MTQAKPETGKPQTSRQSKESSLSTCECGGEIMDLNADTGFCLDCGCEWTSASVYQHLCRTDYDDNENDVPF